MTARIGANLRSGFLHEELGLLLLRRVAVVAEVSRPDDVGIDAVANLLRPVENGLQYADGGTFAVQLKAASVKCVEYNINSKTGHPVEQGHLRWLRELRIPLFMGAVDQATCGIKLFTMQAAYTRLLSASFLKGLRLTFDPVDDDAAGDCPTLYLGPPILEWDTKSADASEFPQKAYELLKGWLELEYDNIKWRRLGYMEFAKWETGKPPDAQFRDAMYQPWGKVASQSLLDELRTPLRLATIDLMATGTAEEAAVGKQLIAILKSKGVDADPGNAIGTMEHAIRVWREAQKQ